MHRFHIPDADFTQSTIELTNKKEIHHFKNVLRLKKDAIIFVFNERGEEARIKILSVHDDKVIGERMSLEKNQMNGPYIILACAIPKKSKFETIIEKTTELGVDEIIPLKTNRTEIQLRDERLAKKQTRFETVALNAAKQSQRRRIPLIHPVTSFSLALENLSKISTVIIPSLQKDRRPIFAIFKKISDAKKISILIGPEGDFTKEEYQLAADHGALAVSLGETVLKVETAAISSVACIKIFFESV